MITGIYQSAAGLDTLTKMQESIANNLANVSTDGFKREILKIQQVNGQPNLEVAPSLDLKSGGLQMTNQPEHLALASEGFFEVNAQDETLYTRNGNFHLDQEGRLVTMEGYALQGKQGDIVLGNSDFTITPAGEVVVNGATVDQIQIMNSTGTMERVGNGLLRWQDESNVQELESGQVHVVQGALEASNVNVIESMVDMMAVVRLYESNQQALQAQDETLKQAISQVGRSL